MDRKSIVYKTSIINSLGVIVSVFIGFIKRKVLLVSLGTDVLAINSIFGDLLAFLALSEFGFQTAIVYRLYKPIHDKDYNSINGLMNILKHVYAVIGLIIMGLGILLLPFLKYVVKDVIYTNSQIAIFFILYIGSSAITYFLSYKRVFLIANQELYKVKEITLLIEIVLNAINIYFVYRYKNFYLFLIMNIVINLAINIAVNYYFDKNYLWYDKTIKINNNDQKNIIDDTKNVFLSKISGFVFNSTDSVLISILINTQLVAYYANYNTIFISIHRLIANAVSSMYNMFGKVLQEDNEQKINRILNNYTFVRFALSHIILSTTMILSTAFVSNYYGSEFALKDIYIYLLGVCNYFLIIFTPINEIINAAGLFKIEKIIQICSVAVNIAFSIVLAINIGLPGIIIGTIVGLLIGFVLRCYFAFKYIIHDINKPLTSYFISNIIYFVYLFAFTCLIKFILNNIVINSLFKFCFIGFICCILSICSLFVFYVTDEFKYALYLINNFIAKICRRFIK